MAKTVITDVEVKLALNKLSEISYKKFGSYSYVAGYQEGMIAQMMRCLSKKDKEMFLSQINEKTIILEK